MITQISTDPAFAQMADDVDYISCSRDQLQDLMDRAPDPHARGFLAGVLAVRHQIAIITDDRLF